MAGEDRREPSPPFPDQAPHPPGRTLGIPYRLHQLGIRGAAGRYAGSPNRPAPAADLPSMLTPDALQRLRSFFAAHTAALPSALQAAQSALESAGGATPRRVDFATKTGRYLALSAAAHVVKNLDDLESVSAWIARSGWCKRLARGAWDESARALAATFRASAGTAWSSEVERDLAALASTLAERLDLTTARLASAPARRVAA